MSDSARSGSDPYGDLLDGERTSADEGETWGECARRLSRERENRKLRLPSNVPVAAEVGLDAAVDALQEDDDELAALFLERTAEALGGET